MTRLQLYPEEHANPKGPGDHRPTALTIVQDEGLINKLPGKVFLVTGGTVSVGLETAKALHATGADVFITARNDQKGRKAADEILQESEGNGRVEAIVMELDSLDSVRAGAASFLEKSSVLNGLISNGAVMGIPRSKTRDGFETVFATNHLAPFLLLQLLLPTLLSSSTPTFNSRFVSIASVSHRNDPEGIHFGDLNLDNVHPYKSNLAYGQSKLANVYTANYVDRHYGSRGLHATSLQPGFVFSGLFKHHNLDLNDTQTFTEEMLMKRKSPQQGAATGIWAALGKEWEGKGGEYLENCGTTEEVDNTGEAWRWTIEGHAPWAYAPELEDRLWQVSLEMAGMK